MSRDVFSPPQLDRPFTPGKMTVVVPAEEELKIESTGSVCTVQGCEKLFQTSSHLQMHLAKHHEGRQLSARVGSIAYYCPVENCERSLPGKKPFPRLGQLKQVCAVLLNP